MEKISLESFNPTKAELEKLAKHASTVKVTDLTDLSQLERVKKARTYIKTKRVEISKQAKFLRDDANKYARAVIALEKDLISIIAPEEKRLQTEEDRITMYHLK